MATDVVCPCLLLLLLVIVCCCYCCLLILLLLLLLSVVGCPLIAWLPWPLRLMTQFFCSQVNYAAATQLNSTLTPFLSVSPSLSLHLTHFFHSQLPLATHCDSFTNTKKQLAMRGGRWERCTEGHNLQLHVACVRATQWQPTMFDLKLSKDSAGNGNNNNFSNNNNNNNITVYRVKSNSEERSYCSSKSMEIVENTAYNQ